MFFPGFTHPNAYRLVYLQVRARVCSQGRLQASPLAGSLAAPLASPLAESLAGPLASPLAGSLAGPLASPLAGSLAGSLAGPLASPLAGSPAGPLASPLAGSLRVRSQIQSRSSGRPELKENSENDM